MTKQDFIKAIEECGVKKGVYKMRFITKGKYGTPEAWLYNVAGKSKFDFQHGLLLEEATLKDKEYLKSYLSDFL